MCVCTDPGLEVRYEPTELIILPSSSRKNGLTFPAAYAANCGSESNKMRCSLREATSRIDLKTTLPCHESVTFCFQFRVFSFLEIPVSVRKCQQEMTVEVQKQSMVILVLLSNTDTVLNKPFHCFPSETGSLQYTHKHPISLAQWLLTVRAHRMLPIFAHSSWNNTSNTGSEICNKRT